MTYDVIAILEDATELIDGTWKFWKQILFLVNQTIHKVAVLINSTNNASFKDIQYSKFHRLDICVQL